MMNAKSALLFVTIFGASVATAARAGGMAIHSFPLAASPASERPIRVAKTSPESDGESVPTAVTDELTRAAPSDAQVRSTHYHSPSDCNVDAAEVTNPLVASGRAALKVSGKSANGKPCRAYAFVDVRLTSEVLVATRPIREGTQMQGAVRMIRREIIAGESPVTTLPDGALASRTLATGQMIESGTIRSPGLNPGSQIRVLVRTGSLSLEETGRVERCSDSRDASRACAQVASGKRVEGRYENGAILVESP